VSAAGRTTLREVVEPRDELAVRDLVRSTGFFTDEEVDIAASLVREALERGEASGYHFLLLADDGPEPPPRSGHAQLPPQAQQAPQVQLPPRAQLPQLVAYTCYGRIPGTDASFDLYWIATRADQHRRGHGRRLLQETERRILRMGGRRVYIETSSRPQYAPTREFYRACGYTELAHFEDFYRPGDGKLVYGKLL
jgi:ribosomal protein S18 acetylase RimI-like enzyme